MRASKEVSKDAENNENAVYFLESRYLTQNRRCNLYTLFEDTPEYYEWTVEDIRAFNAERKKGTHIEDLAYMFGRSTEEIAMAIFDQTVCKYTLRSDNTTNGIYYLFDKNPDFCHWHLEDVLRFDAAYKQKKSIQTLAEMFGRSDEEIALLIFDRALKDKI